MCDLTRKYMLSNVLNKFHMIGIGKMYTKTKIRSMRKNELAKIFFNKDCSFNANWDRKGRKKTDITKRKKGQVGHMKHILPIQGHEALEEKLEKIDKIDNIEIKFYDTLQGGSVLLEKENGEYSLSLYKKNTFPSIMYSLTKLLDEDQLTKRAHLSKKQFLAVIKTCIKHIQHEKQEWAWIIIIRKLQ
jgi:hypothetical protein